MSGWIVGSILMAAGALFIGYSLGLRAGGRKSSLAKDLRISAQEQRIARLERALTTEPAAMQARVPTANGEEFGLAPKARIH
jgi:hypothetical protein